MKILIEHMRTEKDEFEASRRGIANTFAKFYSDLYSKEKPADDKEQDGEDAVQKCDGLGEDGKPVEKKTRHF